MPPPDATQQAPFEVNDYITYSGTLVKDANGYSYISAHTIVASLGIFTAPGTMPAYVAIEDMRLGVGGAPNPLFPQEAVEKLVIIAMTTDPTQLVDFYAVDVDACGTQTNRFYGSADPFGPPIAGKKGRARLRTTVGNFLPATREMRAASRTFTRGGYVDTVLPTAKTFANGIVAGQYHAPNFEFIFPENLVAGGPQVALPLQEFPFLTSGSGPYFGAGTNAGSTALGTLGQISPWPGLTPPSANGCGTNGTVLGPPNANAGAPQTVTSGKVVILDGTASADTNNPPMPLTYTWVQSSGPAVLLQDAGNPKAFFTAPAATAPVVLGFQLVVSNGFASSAIASTTVTVNPTSTTGTGPAVSAGADQTVASGSAVTLTGTVADPATSRFQWTQTAGPAVTLSAPTAITTTFKAPVIAAGQPAATLSFRLTVTDSLNQTGSSTTNVTVKPAPDVVNITSATWRTAGSKLSVTPTSSVTTGAAVLTLHVPGSPDVGMTFDSVAKTYSVPQYIVSPMPGTVSVTSSLGGSAIIGVTQK
jgi:hypothetical protein